MQKSNLKFKNDLRVRYYTFSISIIELANTFPNKRSAWIITNQIIRSVCSVGANLVEVRASNTRLKFKKFYEIALKSANEIKYWLELLGDSKLSSAETIGPLLNEVNEISNMLGAGVIKLKSKI